MTKSELELLQQCVIVFKLFNINLFHCPDTIFAVAGAASCCYNDASTSCPSCWRQAIIGTPESDCKDLLLDCYRVLDMLGINLHMCPAQNGFSTKEEGHCGAVDSCTCCWTRVIQAAIAKKSPRKKILGRKCWK